MMNKRLFALALTVGFAAMTTSAHAILPGFGLEVETDDIGIGHPANSLNDLASFNDTNSNNDLNSHNWTQVDDNDDVGSFNDVASYNDLNSFNTAQYGLLNADDHSKNEVGNIATDYGTILDGDVNVGSDNESKSLGLYGTPAYAGYSETEVAANTGLMYDSIVGEKNAQFGDVGIGWTGGAGVSTGPYGGFGGVNNNQNQLNLVAF